LNAGVATFRGRLVKIKGHRSSSSKLTPMKVRRGAINGFSDKSRKRMLELMATINVPKRCYFVTLTFPDGCAPYSGKDAKRSLRALFERMRRRFPESSAVWRMEIVRRKSGQMKGREVPHFHLLIFNCDLIESTSAAHVFPQGWLNTVWCEIIGADWCRTDVQRLKSERGVMHYCSKYVAKKQEDQDPLVSLPYLHAEGRHWGIFNAAFLPQFVEVTVATHGNMKAFHDFKRTYKRFNKKHRVNHEWQGFTLFTDNAFRWYDYLCDLIEATT